MLNLRKAVTENQACHVCGLCFQWNGRVSRANSSQCLVKLKIFTASPSACRSRPWKAWPDSSRYRTRSSEVAYLRHSLGVLLYNTVC